MIGLQKNCPLFCIGKMSTLHLNVLTTHTCWHARDTSATTCLWFVWV